MTQSQKTILVADDDPAIVDVLVLILEDAGYVVQTATDGATVREEVHATLPDLLLLDIWLSGWNGGDLCMALKSEERTRHIPIILFSANKETKTIAQKAGADDFITKPFELDGLLEKIERTLA